MVVNFITSIGVSKSATDSTKKEETTLSITDTTRFTINDVNTRAFLDEILAIDVEFNIWQQVYQIL